MTKPIAFLQDFQKAVSVEIAAYPMTNPGMIKSMVEDDLLVARDSAGLSDEDRLFPDGVPYFPGSLSLFKLLSKAQTDLKAAQAEHIFKGEKGDGRALLARWAIENGPSLLYRANEILRAAVPGLENREISNDVS